MEEEFEAEKREKADAEKKAADDKSSLEKEMEEMEKTWHQLNRDDIRRKLVSRHESNIQKEEKAGIKR